MDALKRVVPVAGCIRQQLIQLAGRGFAGIAFAVANPGYRGLAATDGFGYRRVAPAVITKLFNGMFSVHAKRLMQLRIKSNVFMI